MIEIYKNLFVGNDNDCVNIKNNFAIIHACKTCHQKGVDYRGNLSSSHPNYLIFENGINLYLNMVDMEQELSPKYTHPIMKSAMNFIDKYIKDKKVLIHCNQGQSRSPSIGLLYLAIKKIINTNTYNIAIENFIQIYHEYLPGRGISLYLKNNWSELLNLTLEK